MNRENARMSDVAAAARVSTATVSRALRDDPRIQPHVRERVKQAARELNYAPHPLVQALMTQRRNRQTSGPETLAVVTNYPHDGWQTKDVCRWYFRGIQQRAQELGYRVEVFSLEALNHDGARLCEVLRARGIRGMLLGFSRDVEQPAVLEVSDFCVVGLSTYFRELPVERVHLNGFHNVKLAFHSLRELGYRRPALVAPESNNTIIGRQWSAAALDDQWSQTASSWCPPLLTANREDEQERFHSWFTQYRPDALLVYKEPVAKWLGALGLRVPGDVGVAFLYGTERERRLTAGIDGELHLVGAAAINLLVQKLHNNDFGLTDHPREVLIPGIWRNGPTVRNFD